MNNVIVYLNINCVHTVFLAAFAFVVKCYIPSCMMSKVRLIDELTE